MRQRKNYKRTERVDQQLHEVISSLFLRQVQDPRVQGIQISAVRTSADLRHAKVYYVMWAEEHLPLEQVATALENLGGFVRSEIAKQIRIKHVPALTFVYDESIERGRQMEALLGGLAAAASSSQEE